MDHVTPKDYLQKYVTSLFPDNSEKVFDGAFDDPHFAVDQTYRPLPEMVRPSC
jgi:hypothetical protein